MSENKKAKAASNVVQHPSATAGADTRIKPLDGWKIQTKYGTLKTRGGVRLVLLEDVHLWMCGNGVPARDAIYKVFSPFLEACLSATEGADVDATKLPESLFLLNAITFPDGMFRGVTLGKTQTVTAFAKRLPELEHVRFIDGSMGGIVYAIAEGANRVWRGVADLETDQFSMSKDRKERALESQYGYDWPTDDELRNLIGRVAAPIETAYELWGWGRVAETADVTPLHVASDTSKEPSTWRELVAFRKDHKDSTWTVKQKCIAAEEAKCRKDAPGAKGVATAMAGELEVTVSRFNNLIRIANESGKREVGRSKAA